MKVLAILWLCLVVLLLAQGWRERLLLVAAAVVVAAWMIRHPTPSPDGPACRIEGIDHAHCAVDAGRTRHRNFVVVASGNIQAALAAGRRTSIAHQSRRQGYCHPVRCAVA